MMSLLPMVLLLSLNISEFSTSSDVNRRNAGAFHGMDRGQGEPTTKAFSRLYNPHHGHEPYWPGGDWLLGVNMSSTEPTSTQVMVCGEECPDNYRPLGQVCAMRLKWGYWEDAFQVCPTKHVLKLFHTRWFGNEHSRWGEWSRDRYRCAGKEPFKEDYVLTYETLDTYCHYLSKVCEDNPQGPRFTYTFVHLGICMRHGIDEKIAPNTPEYIANWKELFQTHFNWGRHLVRANYWERGVRQRLGRFRQTPFVPHRWPHTTATAEENTTTPAPPRHVLLREAIPHQEPSDILEAWQDYLRILR